MSIWPAVHGILNNEHVEADVINRPIHELVARTNYLKTKVTSLMDSDVFESVRLRQAPLAQPDDLLGETPEVGDAVCLDAASGKYRKAVASMSLLDEFTAADSSRAVGMLVDKAGSTGTVCVSGKLLMSTAGLGWTLADLVEPGETFRPGGYYLSNLHPGKLTATPSGPVVYIGELTASTSDPLLGGYAVVNPQHRDTGDSHVHRSFRLQAKPAGAQVVTSFDPTGVHHVVGYRPDGIAQGLEPVETDRIPGLAVVGTWTGLDAAYTVKLGTEATGDIAPTTFEDGVYLHWTSTDLTEGTNGAGKSRVFSFEVPVAIGTRGLQVVLENPDSYVIADCDDWDEAYSAETDDIGFRTWTLDMPIAGQGWKDRRHRVRFYDAGDHGFSILCLGGPMSNADNRHVDAVTLKLADAVYRLNDAGGGDLALPSVGDSTVVGTDVYEYTDGSPVTAGATPVLIAGDAEDPMPTYLNLLDAMLEVEAEKDEANRVVPIVDEVNLTFVIGAPDDVDVTHLGVVVAPLVKGAGSDGVATVEDAYHDPDDAANALAYDSLNRNLAGVSGYWAGVTVWTPKTLANGTVALPIPFDSDWAPTTDYAANANGTWTAELVDNAPGAKFEYAVGMQPGLSAFYPPVPAKAAALVLNGVELDPAEFFEDIGSYTYSIGSESIYWYKDAYSSVPWPVDWVGMATPVTPYLAQRMLLHFTRNTVGGTGHVTSVRPAPGSPITVTQCGTNEPATTGDLELRLNLVLETEDAGVGGFRVVKDVRNGKLRRGPVVEKILPGPGVSITQLPGCPAGQGTTIISLSGGQLYSGDFEEIALENAKQELIGMFPFIRLLGWRTGGQNIDTGFMAKFRVPHNALDAYYRVAVYATVFGTTAVPALSQTRHAGLEFSFSILPDVNPIGAVARPAQNLVDGLIQPASPMLVDVPLGDPTLSPVYNAYDPVLIHNDPSLPDIVGHQSQVLGVPFPTVAQVPAWAATMEPDTGIGVRPGSLVGVKFSRGDTSTPALEYTGPIGFINLRWSLIPV